MKCSLPGKRLQTGQQHLLAIQQINLVHCQDYRALKIPEFLQYQLIIRHPAHTLYQEDHDIDILQCTAGSPVHMPVHGTPAESMDTGCIDINSLHRGFCLDTEHPVTRCLGTP